MTVLIAAVSIGFCLTSFAETGQSIGQLAEKSRINDKTEFTIIKDENGNERLIKTIVLIEFTDQGLKLKAGKPISTDDADTTISEDFNLFEQ
ncbi:MAG: hypothetical protein ACRENF_03450 [Thermodesulfobacteriota bacterium]